MAAKRPLGVDSPYNLHMELWLGRCAQALAVVACLATGVSAIPSNLWWIRALDFARIPMLAVIAVLLLVSARWVRTARLLTVAGLLVAGTWQAWRIRDYTPVVAAELPLDAEAHDQTSCFTAIGFNVLQHNRNYARTLALLQREQPDVLLLMETDSLWLAALGPVLASYPHVSQRALDNTYGMIFASRLAVDAAHFEHPTSANTPTFYATVTTREGRSFDFVGLHPRPPLPGQDTDQRDASIARAAQRQAGDPAPGVAMGDFNDVAWSRTTQRFKSDGGYLDPRVGRGPYASFPARYTRVGWPLDQIFVTPAFTVGFVRILENVGSDHRPLAVRLCLRRQAS